MKTLVFLLVLFHGTLIFAEEPSGYIKVKCVIHIHTDVSSGTRSLGSYVKEAGNRGIGAIILTDEDWRRWEFGLPPFRRWIKKVVQEKSVMTYGIEGYLNLIRKTNEENKGLVIIDGVETTPFYFWSGNLLKGSLALNNRNKDMLVIGLDNPDDYRNMPLVTNHKSGFDAYHGDQFTRPYQELIDYVIKKGGLVFWSHPEYEENILEEGVRLLTVPYQWDLVGTYRYTGFAIFWEGYKEAGKPNGIWDRVLTEYCQGRRTSPVWAMGELEEEGRGDKNLDDVVNMIYVKDLNRPQVLDALRKGKFYVTYKEFDRIPLVLEDFTVSDESRTKRAMMGEEVAFPGSPIIKISLSHERPIDKEITVRLIRNNEIIKEFNSKSRIEIEYKDEGVTENKKYYYRLDVESQGNSQLVSNPIFFKKVSQ